MRIKPFLPGLLAAASLLAVAADPSPDTVLVRKGDLTVTTGDFLANLEKIPADDRFAFRADVDRITNNVSSIFVMRSLADEARKKGIDKEPDVQRRVRLAEEAVLSQIEMERFQKSIVPPDYDARAEEIYKSTPERFERPFIFKARRIVVGLQGRTDEEAKRRAEEALAKLHAGEQAGAVTREYTTDPNYRNNGGIYQGQVNLVPDEEADALRTAPLNQPVGPIKTSNSYDIVIVLDRRPGYTVPFEKAKGEIIKEEEAKYRKAKTDEMLGTITQSKDIKIDTDAIASLKTEIDRPAIHKFHEEKLREEQAEKARILADEAKKGKAN